ncbi:integrin plexin domain-containing protein [Ditylenchus destructor]|uniref:Integrin plexin domain-containing protein n=1 Tax=Ditylenchus destructor TaxID=166010 RepID=A0AAD4NF70_9BILA|nr:integrin plexin domain-containing protein [Ditylenchus destructor]
MRRKASLQCHSQMNGGSRSSLFYSYNIHFAALCILVLLVQISRCEDDAEIRQKCLSGSEGCAQCIKQHPDCAWCADPRTNISRRCDIKSQLDQSTCSPNHVISPTTEIKVAPQHNLPLGGRRADSTTPIQLEPQQVEIRMKPGDIVEVPFRYLHKIPATGYEVNDFTIQTSEFRSLGLEIEFSVECNGERVPGRVCAGVKPDQKISFYAKVSLNDCSNSNLIAVSVGIYGYNTVSAIFVSPLCGCDCENPRYQEKRSPKCGYKGNLVCGVCQCDQGKGGDRCECDLNQYGVSSPEDLLNQCKEHRTAPVCSGKGKCSCGKCTCEADYIKGKYCECDSANCPLGVDGRFCSGRGECDCGKCVCERGYSGDDCSCSDDPTPCTENQVVKLQP